MTVQEIYEAALGLLGEPIGEGTDGDYSERAPYIISAFCCDTARVDRDYRETRGLGEQPSFSEVYIDLGEEFPFCPRFATAAAYYLAAMLILEEDESRADILFDRYCDSLASIEGETPASLGKIRNVYFR